MSHNNSASLLNRFGWDVQVETQFSQYRAQGLIPGRVIKVDRSRCDVYTSAGPVTAGTRALTSAVCTGDWVAVSSAAPLEIVAILPRRSAITRASSDRTSHTQILAANVDVTVVVTSLAAPLKPGRVERLVALGWESGTQPLVVLTKADLAGHAAATRSDVAALAPGVDVLTTSTTTGEGLDALAAHITGTGVLLGPSGAGKSSLVNALLGEHRLATQDVRPTDSKGRHTTVHRELIPLPNGGVLIDTPGLRGIGLQDAADGIEKAYADIEALAAQCRFRDCQHRAEPGCAVLHAVESGSLQQSRLERYRKVLRESEWATARGDARLRNEREKAGKAQSREIRAMYKSHVKVRQGGARRFRADG